MVRDVKPGGTFLINCQWYDEELAEHMPAEAKQLHRQEQHHSSTLINAIDLAAKIGMGKRTNTILQSAFFALAKVLPAEEAIQYMKDAATKSYMKKGQAVVDMNHKAIDAGATAFAQDRGPRCLGRPPPTSPRSSRSRVAPPSSSRSRSSSSPSTAWTATACPSPPSSEHVDGQFELGASAYEKRGVAVIGPEVGPESKCIQCNSCAFVCPHATIRPFALTDEEVAAAPENLRTPGRQGPQGQGHASSPWPSPRWTAWAAPSA